MNLNDTSMHAKPQHHQHPHHKPANTVYRKAILKAIEDLHDCQLRSNVDSIRRHVMSSTLDSDHHAWNEVIFMKTLKSVVHEGEIEPCANTCALSPEYKKRRSSSVTAYMNDQQMAQQQLQLQQQQHYPPNILGQLPPASVLVLHQYPESPKQPPKRKAEHDKYKLMPKPPPVFVNPPLPHHHHHHPTSP